MRNVSTVKKENKDAELELKFHQQYYYMLYFPSVDEGMRDI